MIHCKNQNISVCLYWTPIYEIHHIFYFLNTHMNVPAQTKYLYTQYICYYKCTHT